MMHINTFVFEATKPLKLKLKKKTNYKGNIVF